MYMDMGILGKELISPSEECEKEICAAFYIFDNIWILPALWGVSFIECLCQVKVYWKRPEAGLSQPFNASFRTAPANNNTVE